MSPFYLEKAVFICEILCQEDVLILPKLFRRLVSFNDRYADFDKLEPFIKKQRDNLELADGSKKKSLADLMEFHGRR